MAEQPLEFWDPHFHIWDLREGSGTEQDGSVLFECAWLPDEPKLYTAARYETDCSSSSALRHVGGAYIESMSVSHVDTPGADLQASCLAEARWVAAQLAGSDRLYRLAPSVCLEAPNALETLQALAEIKHVVGVRQIINYEPSWPRNKAAAGDLLSNEQWRAGFGLLKKVNFSFDMQLNPSQFSQAAGLLKQHPEVNVIINHLGCPTKEDLTTNAAQYWDGMSELAALGNVWIKVSMLCYTEKEWDKSELLVETVRRLVELFGDTKVCFATNFPVDWHTDGFTASRLYAAFLQMADKIGFSQDQRRRLFAGNARAFYRADEEEGPTTRNCGPDRSCC